MKRKHGKHLLGLTIWCIRDFFYLIKCDHIARIIQRPADNLIIHSWKRD